jgi:dimethylglycine dehydrogenase
MAGIELPLMPVEHHYMVTENIPLIEQLDFELPQINDNETGCYARQEGKGMLLGAYENQMRHWAKDGTPLDFGHELLPDNLACMEENIEQSIQIMPCLAEAGIKRVINGPMIFSPDLGPLIGPHPAVTKLFLRQWRDGRGLIRAPELVAYWQNGSLAVSRILIFSIGMLPDLEILQQHHIPRK